MPTENYTSKFRVDVSDLKKGLADANAAIKKANAEFKNATAGTKDWEKSADGLTAAITSQRKVIEEEEKKLSLLKEQLGRLNDAQKNGEKIVSDLSAKYNEAAEKYGATSEEAKKYAKQLSDAESAQERNRKAAEKLELQIINQDTALKKAKAQCSDYETALDSLGNEEKQAETAIDKLGDEFEETGKDAQKATDGGLSAFTVALGNLAANVITAAIDKLGQLGEAALDSFENFDKGSDAVIKATGATGKAADEMRKAYADAAKSVSGDLEDIGAATGEVNTRFGFTGDKLTEATTAFTKFADITGGDATVAVRNVSRAIESAGLEADDYKIILDQLATAAQASGISADTLAERLTTYGAQMRAAGYDTSDTIAMLASWEKAGVNTETAITGIRKALANFGKDGKNAKEELSALIDEIKSAPDDTAAAQIALNAFGNKAGSELADDIRSGRFEFEAFTETIANSAGAVENTFNETQSGVDKIKLAAQSLRVTVGEAAGKLLDTIAPNLEEVISLFGAVVSSEEGVAEKLGEGVGNLLTNIISKAVDFIPKLVKLGTSLLSSVIQGVISALPDAITALSGGIQTLLNALSTLLPQVISAVLDALPAINEALFNALPMMLEGIINLISAMADKLPEILEKALKTAPKVWATVANAIKSGLPKIVQAVQNLLKTLTARLPEIMKILTAELPNIIGTIADIISTTYPVLIESAVTLIQAVIDALPEIIKIFDETAPELLKAVGQALIDNAPLLLETAKQVWSIVLDAIPALLSGLWDIVKTSISTELKYIGDLLSPVGKWLDEHVFTPITEFFEPVVKYFENAFNIIKELAEGCWKLIKTVWNAASTWFSDNVITPVKNVFSGMWDKLKEGASVAWDGIKSVFNTVADFFTDTFGGAWQKVKDIFSEHGEVFEGIKDGIVTTFKNIVNGLINGINTVVSVPFNNLNNILDTLHDMEVLGVKPFENLVTRIDVPEIPQLEYGGILKRGQLGLLEGKNDEAVIPLQNNTEGLRRIAGLLSAEMGGGRTETVNNYNFTQTNNSPKPLSRWDIYRQTKNLMNAMKGV
jgi:TP901 family phage tail tape measure protein